MVCLKGVTFRLIILLLQVNDKYKILVQENQKTRQAARLGLSKDAKESKTDSYILPLYMFKLYLFIHYLVSAICLALSI